MSLLIGAGNFGISEAQQAAQDARDQAVAAKNTSVDVLNNIGVFSPGSVAALRTRSGLSGTRVEMMGYYAPGDGGGGLFYWDATATDPDDGATVIKVTDTDTGRYRRVTNSISVKMFGAKGDGLTNDRDAIQAAINWAKKQKSPNGADKRMTVIFPHGTYRINGTKGIDVTNANGIILEGASTARYVATSINGNCTGPIFDFTGSNQSGCVGLSLFSDVAEQTPARTAALFALGRDASGNDSGGLGCYMRDCYIQMSDMPGQNNGFGSIGVVNIRSEQFSMADCFVKSNLGVMLSNRSDVQGRRNNNTFKSDFYTIQTGVGSMGVSSLKAISVETNGSLQPGLLLNGVNGLKFEGYISIGNPGTGPQEYAIEQYQPMFCSTFVGTIEGYRGILYQAGHQYQCMFRLSYANIGGAKDKDVFLIDNNARIDGADIGVVFGNGASEMGSRNFIGATIGSGDAPIGASIVNSKISCSDWPDNRKFLPKALLKQSQNTQFMTGQPFEKRAGFVRRTSGASILVGIDNAAANGTVKGKLLRFEGCDKTNAGNTNGGIYEIIVDGTLVVGEFNTAAAVSFKTVMLLHQTDNGTRQAVQQTTTLYGGSSPFPGYATITAIVGSVTFDASNVGSIVLTVTTGGSHAGEAVVFAGDIAIRSNFWVNETSLFD